MMNSFCNFLLKDVNWNTVAPIVAVIISIFALFINIRIAQKNTRLTILQALFKTVTDKVKDCNTLWGKASQLEGYQRLQHREVVSELIISIEVIDKFFELFQRNYKTIRRKFEADYYYLFWKQLQPDLRGWVIDHIRSIAATSNNEYYKIQVSDIIRKFQDHFEKKL